MVADRFFASSKLCSSCEHRLAELALSVREWVCPACGARHDRDGERGVEFEEFGGEFHCVSLWWRGRLWFGAQAPNETGLGEAGSQRRICSEMNRFAGTLQNSRRVELPFL